MQKPAVEHNYSANFLSAAKIDELVLRLRAARGDLKEVKVIYGDRFGPKSDPEKIKNMTLSGSTEVHDYFSARLQISSGRFRYYFYLEDWSNTKLWYCEKGLTRERPRGWTGGYFQFPKIKEEDLWQAPDWAPNSVFYQIFPERFARSKEGKKTTSKGERLTEWGKIPDRKTFMGGDLKGITGKLDYLQQLGISAIYLTPIFQSPSNHKYDISDYYQIDRDFGTEEDARELVNKAHQRGIKVLLDGVFNHCGAEFFAFQDVLRWGKKSRYREWFYLEGFPVEKDRVNYQTFARNVASMPRLNLENEEVQEYFLQVAEYWTEKLGIDGWRLDVADEVPGSFWRKFQQRIKSVNPEAFIIGEVWYNGAGWMKGDQFDSIMNYHLMYDILDLLWNKSISASRFSSRVQQNLFRYRPGAVNFLLNLLDSHDTPRLSWRFKDLDSYSAVKYFQLAVTLQFTLPGIPMVYYGDEVGLSGGHDPDCRRAMIWDSSKQNSRHKNFYQKLIRLYRSCQALKNGRYQEVFVDDASEILIFSRNDSQAEERKILVAANFSDRKYSVKWKNVKPSPAAPEVKSLNAEVIFSLSNMTPCLQREDFIITGKEIIVIKLN